MDIEHDLKIITIDDNFQKELEKISNEGWIIPPGIPGIAVYHLVRPKGAQPQAPAGDGLGGVAKLAIDDTKVHILKPDGTLQ